MNATSCAVVRSCSKFCSRASWRRCNLSPGLLCAELRGWGCAHTRRGVVRARCYVRASFLVVPHMPRMCLVVVLWCAANAKQESIDSYRNSYIDLQ